MPCSTRLRPYNRYGRPAYRVGRGHIQCRSLLTVTIILMIINKVRTELKAACVAVLTQYRKYCSGRSQPGQLILPEALKLLPIYLLGLLKSNLLRLNTGRSGVLIPAVRIEYEYAA